MYKKIKLTDEGFEKLKKAIGVDFGLFNLDSEIIKVGSYGFEDVILQLDRLYGIKDIDMVPYNPSPAQRDVQEELVDRIQMIGHDVRVGSVVRIKLDGKTRHVVVIAVNGKIYDCALMNLKVANMNEVPEHAMRLYKDQDVLYRNLTYRDVVEVTDDVITNVKVHYLINAGGIVAGRIINEYTMMRIIKMCKARMNMPRIPIAEADAAEADEDNGENNPGVNQPAHEAVVKSHNTEPVAETHDMQQSGAKPVEVVESRQSEVQQPEDISEAIVPKNNVEMSGNEDLAFEDRVSRAKDLDTLFECLEIDSLFLKLAIRICVENQRVNMKNLYGTMQGRQQELCVSQKLSQNAIKNVVGKDFVIWLGDKRVSIEKADISYFLKTIIKSVKN